MRAVATPGRWIWRLSGLTTTAALVVVGSHLITSAGQAEYAQPQTTVTRTVTVSELVNSLTVQSYGAPVQVTGAPVRHVQITETLMYDSQAGNLSAVPQPASAVPQPASAGPLSAPPSAPSAPGGALSGAPAVVQSVSGGRLSVGDPACANSDCSVSFAVTVPSDVTAIVSTEGGSVSVSGIAGANLDSGGGPVSAAHRRHRRRVAAAGRPGRPAERRHRRRPPDRPGRHLRDRHGHHGRRERLAGLRRGPGHGDGEHRRRRRAARCARGPLRADR
jgi:hypothetical protein